MPHQQDADASDKADALRDDAGGLPYVRTGVAGLLMGLANLVPGVSGGTMILVVGLYDEFVSAIADVVRLRFRRRAILFLLVLVPVAVVTIALLSGTMSRAVTDHRSAMYSLFIGMTLGGTPVLLALIRPVQRSMFAGLVVGLAAMIVIGPPPERPASNKDADAQTAAVDPGYARDLAAGALGMSAMVLPGISGAHMMLILGRYEPILAAISSAKNYAVSRGDNGDPAVFLRVLVPVAVGALASLVLLSNLLKWLLARHPQPTIGALLGVLFGAAYAIWPFSADSVTVDYVLGAALALAGLGLTILLSRIRT